MEIYYEIELNDDRNLLRELVLKFYTSYNTINLIGNFKTKVFGNRLVLDDNSIGAILRIMLEIKLIVFIFENFNNNNKITKFRFYILKYCDIKNSQNNLINYKNNEIHDQQLTEIYALIKSNDEYKTLSKESINAIKKGNWAKFHNGFLFPNSNVNNSIIASFWYSHFSTFIHTTFTSLNFKNFLLNEKSRHENKLIYFGMASFIGKEILILLDSIKNEALIKTNYDYNLNLNEKFEIWNQEIENNKIFESELREI
ncbi:hypothetical protein [Leptospira vanthielii]|uniref:Uncharacterized protein n=1 Tax=Leptospira vanthielii serovar Holland str. Waz Holland = ATCC 700522 TaxID=1218591 RepID=N1WFF0_9LEPT|nr:hypothetical protein [Leptospira vanthielii]EMY71957.1 hypothetical protein LEP1GSC199_0636 [Leptospira vanthielii serovar Holland str. Waz Holland = ATCC 700522]